MRSILTKAEQQTLGEEMERHLSQSSSNDEQAQMFKQNYYPGKYYILKLFPEFVMITIR